MTTASELARLERIDDLRSVWQHEAHDFTPWLAQAENLALLAETLGIGELEMVAQEQAVGAFSADILCRDTSDDSFVLIENQIQPTDHTHLGQLLTYAAGLQTVSIIWVAAKFRDEHRAALDWLNGITDERFRFFGLEIELWRIGNSPLAPKFNIVAEPNDWTRSVKPVSKSDGSNLADRKEKNRRFWEQLCAYLKKTGSPVNLEHPKPKLWLVSSISTNAFLVSASRPHTRDGIGFIRVDLRCVGPNRLANLDSLKEQQQDIENEIGESLKWPRKVGGLVELRNPDKIDLMDESNWPAEIEWMTDALERFERAFGPHIEELSSDE